MKPFIKEKGFSLIELVMVIIIMGIISTTVAQMYSQALYLNNTEQGVNDALYQGQIAMQRLERDLANLRSAGDITTMTGAKIVFADNLGNTIQYVRSAGFLQLNYNATGNTPVAAISGLTFKYYVSTGTVTAVAANIAYITVKVTVTENTTNYSLTSGVHIRDLIQ